MNKQFLIFLGLAVILGLIFYQTNRQQSEPTDEKSSEDVTMVEEHGGDAMDKEDGAMMEENRGGDAMEKEDGDAMKAPEVIKIAEQTFQKYSNQAVGYTIDQPTNWYWEHFHLARLTEAHPGITDIYASDRKPLPSLEKIYDSKIIIEVSANDPTSAVEGFTTTKMTIDGNDAVRHEGSRDGRDVIEYHVHVGSSVVRFIYSADEKNESEAAVFDHIVNSFSL